MLQKLLQLYSGKTLNLISDEAFGQMRKQKSTGEFPVLFSMTNDFEGYVEETTLKVGTSNKGMMRPFIPSRVERLNTCSLT